MESENKMLKAFLEQSNMSLEQTEENSKNDIIKVLKAQREQAKLEADYKDFLDIPSNLNSKNLNKKTKVSEQFENHSLDQNRLPLIGFDQSKKDSKEFDEPEYDEMGRIIIDL